MNTGCRVCYVVGSLITTNGSIVVVSSRLPRMLKVSSEVCVVGRNGFMKRIDGRRTASRLVVSGVMGSKGKTWEE